MKREEKMSLIETEMRKSVDEWRLKVYGLINDIPVGHVITYGGLATRLYAKYGLHKSPRNIAWLRKYLYSELGFDTSIPLHRIACRNDPQALKDSLESRYHTQLLRRAEGSWSAPQWLFE